MTEFLAIIGCFGIAAFAAFVGLFVGFVAGMFITVAAMKDSWR